MRTKPLILVKNKKKIGKKSGMLNIRAKRLSLPFAILNTIRANIRTEPGCCLFCIACRLVYYHHIVFSPVTDCTKNKHYKRYFLFLSDFLLYHTPIYGIIDHYCIMRNFKKIRKNQEQIKNSIPLKS